MEQGVGRLEANMLATEVSWIEGEEEVVRLDANMQAIEFSWIEGEEEVEAKLLHASMVDNQIWAWIVPREVSK